MRHTPLLSLRDMMDNATYSDETTAIERLTAQAGLSETDRTAVCANAAQLVRDIRGHARPGLMEVFLAEYGLSTEEGVALMCLAEALLRVPDADTIDALIEDKIAPSNWGFHLGKSTSSLVNATTWGLLLTGRVLKDEGPGPIGHLHGMIKRLGEPVIRTAVNRAMREMGAQFVLGENIQAAMKRARPLEKNGYTYSYDMLGEAARTEADARRYHLEYSKAIGAIADAAVSDDIRENPGISVKLSALFPRYEEGQRDAVMTELVPRLLTLAQLARSANIGLNVDAEEADRLSLSLDVIENVLADESLKGWNGFGVVVQAYGPRAGLVIDYLYAVATKLDRKIMLRLVKGAYWDQEVKRAQVMGLENFPVFTSKAATDVSYIANARKLLNMTDRIYPQFATHNAHTAAAILYMAKDPQTFEFQRLHGMGDALHELVKDQNQTRCRIYAPVGAHHDLLAYLVRRLLENGANSSFVNQIVDEKIAPEIVAADPFLMVKNSGLTKAPDLYAPERVNSKGWDLTHRPTIDAVETARTPFKTRLWSASPLLATSAPAKDAQAFTSPSNPSDQIGQVQWATPEDVALACDAGAPWTATPEERKTVLNRAADLFEENYGEFFALLTREAGKTQIDAVAEIREAVDFLRYYGARGAGEAPVGLFACISPWNFPLAIFAGQISAALAAGNGVLAKPAEQTSLIAYRAIEMMHEAGVPKSALQLLPGAGDVGAALTSNPAIGGVAFTGSTDTAQIIHRTMAKSLAPGAPLIAETGGLNAMIVDSTALPEQAIQAIIESAFQSAGQRCSALRCLYVQEDIAEGFLKMLKGAMDILQIGQPWHLSTDVGPVIDQDAKSQINAHIEIARQEGRVLFELDAPEDGFFVAPTLIKIGGIADLEREIFGPVLHVATFKSRDLDQVIDAINDTGYGLTFGLQTRIDDRVQHVVERIKAGNIYVNRNQIGAIVGSQPFGGEGLSGTGPKAGGPTYLERFRCHSASSVEGEWSAKMTVADVQTLLSTLTLPDSQLKTSLPGPTGESNVLTALPRAPVLCVGPTAKVATQQAQAIRALGGAAIEATGALLPEDLETLSGISSAIWWGDEETARAYRIALSKRSGPILTLVTGNPDLGHALHERHVCVDTTAAGGNATLLAESS